MTTNANGRTADHDIAPLFLERWSPRDFTAEPMADADLFRLFEAARWAPSSSNQQPWRFLYAKRDTSDFTLFLDLLSDGNKSWANDTSALIALVSKRVIAAKGDRPARDNYNHSFDTGAAWACFALQASMMGWAAHAIGGFDLPRAIRTLGIPDDYRIEAMIGVGRHRAPAEPTVASTRGPQSSFVRQGVFGPRRSRDT